MLGYKVCQKEKIISIIPTSLLEPLTLLKHKWADMSMGFIMGLLVFDEGYDGMHTVIDRAMKLVHLLPMKQTISVSKSAHV